MEHNAELCIMFHDTSDPTLENHLMMNTDDR
jgi:hypothetical protein